MTLIELMIAAVILVIIASAAGPQMKSLFERKSVFASGDFFIKSIKLARLEAIQRGTTVNIIANTGTGDWSQGWNISTIDGNGVVQTIRNFPAIAGSPIFTSQTYDGSPTFSILPTGQVSDLGSFELYYPDCTGDKRLTFNVLISGLVQRSVSSCSN